MLRKVYGVDPLQLTFGQYRSALGALATVLCWLDGRNSSGIEVERRAALRERREAGYLE